MLAAITLDAVPREVTCSMRHNNLINARETEQTDRRTDIQNDA